MQTCILVILFADLCIADYYYKQTSTNGRLLIWKVSADMVAGRPVTKLRDNRFYTYYTLYQINYFPKHPHTQEAIYADNTMIIPSIPTMKFLNYERNGKLSKLFYLLPYTLHALPGNKQLKPNVVSGLF